MKFPDPSNVVANIPDAPTGGVLIDGIAQGQILVANTSNLADLDGQAHFHINGRRY